MNVADDSSKGQERKEEGCNERIILEYTYIIMKIILVETGTLKVLWSQKLLETRTMILIIKCQITWPSCVLWKVGLVSNYPRYLAEETSKEHFEGMA